MDETNFFAALFRTSEGLVVVCYGPVHAGVTWNAEPSPEKQSSLEGDDEERLYNDNDDALKRGVAGEHGTVGSSY
jgi:hypothetical protein